MAKPPIDDPNGPQNPQPEKPKPVTYGQQGLKTGVAKADQARNQEGFVPRGQRDGVPNVPSGGTNPDDGNPSNDVPEGTDTVATTNYLTPEQQAKVDKWLGDSYDPNKALNVQLFKARWAAADIEQRRAMAQNIKDKYLEGGPTGNKPAQFHESYIDLMRYENSIAAAELRDRMNNFHSTLGGWAVTQESADAFMAHWTEFANTEAGQAHIAGTGMTTEEWLARQQESMQSGADNYANQLKRWTGIQGQAQRLGLEIPGFKPPGWESTLESIKAGTAHLPSAEFMAMYPGIVADLAGIPDIGNTELLQNRRNAGFGGGGDRGDYGTGTGTGADTSLQGAEPALGTYQPYIAPTFSASDIEYI